MHYPMLTPLQRKLLAVLKSWKNSPERRGAMRIQYSGGLTKKIYFCMLQRYTANSESISGVRVVAGNVNGAEVV